MRDLLAPRIGGGVALAATAILIAVPAALAGGQVSAVPRDRFATRTVVIAQGQVAVLHNSDTNRHNVTSTGSVAGSGAPLFVSRTIGRGQSSAINGTQYLRSGHYSFICSLHSFMTGTLVVTRAGHPKTRPHR